MKRPLMLAVGAATGFIGLSYEILWLRAYSFVTGGTASSFGVLLGAYLLGLAVGSLASWAYCSDRTAVAGPEHMRAPALLVLVGSALGFLSIPLLAELVRRGSFVPWLLAVAVTAGVLGAVLPLVSHLAIAPDERAGTALSYLYVANIVGSAAGSLLTGFVLLDHLSLPRISALLAILGVAVALLLVAASRPASRQIAVWGIAAALVLALTLVGEPALFRHIFEKLQFKQRFAGSPSFADIVENRSGVITVQEDGTVYGGGVYDGAYSVDLVHDRNLIVRPYALSAIHPSPRRVLLIGLSTGSWAQVLVSNPDVERLTVIEINPGYLGLIPKHPEVASLLENPKLEIVIDDGRRWLAAHPDRLFDAIFSNTTWHWRSMATNLLSAEFLELTRRHLAPGGVFLWNTTFSIESQKTGCEVFRHGFRLVNSMVGSDSPVRIDPDRWRKSLREYRIDGRLIFDESDPEHARRLEEILRIGPTPGHPERRNRDYQPCEDLRRFARDLVTVTDDNMVIEWYRPWWAAP